MRALRLPAALQEAVYSLTWHRGVHIYTADVPKSSWHDVKHRQGMIAIFAGRTAGEAHWMDAEGDYWSMPLRPGTIWFVAPEVPHACKLHRKSEVVMIFLERWRMEEGLGPRYARVAGTGSIARLRDYFKVQPILRDLHLAVAQQSKGLPLSRDESRNPNQIDVALAFARNLWLLHYCGLRTQLDGVSPESVLRELEGED